MTDKIISDFRAFVKAKGVEIKQDEFQRDLSYIRLALKATIARPLYNWDGYFQILSPVDNQFQKALTLFPEAQRIAGLK